MIHTVHLSVLNCVEKVVVVGAVQQYWSSSIRARLKDIVRMRVEGTVDMYLDVSTLYNTVSVSTVRHLMIKPT